MISKQIYIKTYMFTYECERFVHKIAYLLMTNDGNVERWDP